MLRLAIDSDNADAARTVNEQVLHAMDVVAGAESQLHTSAGPQPCWYVHTKLDLSGRKTITPDDAPTRFKLVIRNLPHVPFMGQGDNHHGLWEWLPDSWGLAMASQGRRAWRWLPDSWGQPRVVDGYSRRVNICFRTPQYAQQESLFLMGRRKMCDQMHSCHTRARTGGKLRSPAVTHGHRE